MDGTFEINPRYSYDNNDSSECAGRIDGVKARLRHSNFHTRYAAAFQRERSAKYDHSRVIRGVFINHSRGAERRFPPSPPLPSACPVPRHLDASRRREDLSTDDFARLVDSRVWEFVSFALQTRRDSHITCDFSFCFCSDNYMCRLALLCDVAVFSYVSKFRSITFSYRFSRGDATPPSERRNGAARTYFIDANARANDIVHNGA